VVRLISFLTLLVPLSVFSNSELENRSCVDSGTILLAALDPNMSIDNKDKKNDLKRQTKGIGTRAEKSNIIKEPRKLEGAAINKLKSFINVALTGDRKRIKLSTEMFRLDLKGSDTAHLVLTKKGRQELEAGFPKLGVGELNAKVSCSCSTSGSCGWYQDAKHLMCGGCSKCEMGMTTSLAPDTPLKL